jgi:hypothetical protein
MMFRKKNPVPGAGIQNPAMRGRDDENSERAANALARRFQEDDEPETIDLVGAEGFPGEESPAEPETRVTAPVPEKNPSAERRQLISCEPGTGKFYVHAGTEQAPVFLAGEPVTAATELRRGDRIRVGDVELEFLA